MTQNGCLPAVNSPIQQNLVPQYLKATKLIQNYLLLPVLSHCHPLKTHKNHPKRAPFLILYLPLF